MNYLWTNFIESIVWIDWSDPVLWLLVFYILALLVLASGLVFLTIQLHHNNEKKSLHWQQREAKWTPLIMAVQSGQLWPDALMEQIPADERFFFIDFAMRYVPHMPPDVRAALSEQLNPTLDLLVRKLKSGDDEQRARVVLTLTTLNFTRYQSALAESLEDESPLVAMLAARALSDAGAIKYLNTILERLDLFQSWSLSYLVSMLVALAKDDPHQLLTALRKKTFPDWLQTVILNALTELNCTEAVSMAAYYLDSDSDPEVQAAALHLLAKLGKGLYLDQIREKCAHPNFVIRLHAIKALAKIGQEEDGQLLFQLMTDASHWVAMHATQALKELGREDLLESFIETTHPHAKLALQVLYAPTALAEMEHKASQASFVGQIPQYMRAAYLHDSLMLWQQINHLLYLPTTHPDVKKEIVAHLRPESAPLIYEEALTHLADPTTPIEPLLLVQILHRIQPEASLKVISEFYFHKTTRAVQQEILALFEQHAATHPNYAAFIHHARMIENV